MASLLLGKKTLPLQKRFNALNPTKNDWTYSNKLIVVRVAIVESLFRMHNKKKGEQLFKITYMLYNLAIIY